MKPSILLILIISFYLVSCSGGVKQAESETTREAGKVVQFYGGAIATLKEKSRKLTKGSVLYPDDLIRTGASTRLKIELADGAEFILGDLTTMRIEYYRFNKGSGDGQGQFKIYRGFFHSKSGIIAKKRPKKFRIKTAFASIAVKGTEFWGGFWDGGKFEVALLKGTAVIISNKAGSVELNKVGWGTTLVNDTTAPTPPKQWGQEKIKRAFATVSWNQP